jgi:hypothetical protein
MPAKRRPLSRLPIPKYLRIKKMRIPVVVRKARLCCMKMIEKVRKRVKKTRMKNRGTARKISGSMKKM